MEDVKLHSIGISIFGSRVIWALKLKGVDYEYIEEDLQNKSESLLKYNPVYMKVPVLVHGGKPISESMIIVEYIDETWPDKYLILPKDPYERSVARFWAKFAGDMEPFLTRYYCTRGEEQAKVMKDILGMLRSVEEHGLGDGRKFFGGEILGFADLAFARLILLFKGMRDITGLTSPLEVEEFPRLQEWMERFSEVPVIKENQPNYDEWLAYAKREMENLFPSPSA
ncbi:hypothetical protein MKW94_022178 [Papaver nudicaule]|uniref:glutathione transferase n=1 Tax=Papaver nudicaule TaxID=74823 RepID=A0AA41W0N7_PAPNU|nr:hypothetical protein [Papaver nudicaule]